MEFVSSAYSDEEAWCDMASTSPGVKRKANNTSQIHMVHRRLSLPTPSGHAVSVVLVLSMPKAYPATSPLEISSTVEEDRSTGGTKMAHNALPVLAESCRQVAAEMCGDESVFSVLSHADEWIQDQWPSFCQDSNTTNKNDYSHNNNSLKKPKGDQPIILGRRLIYSHHIISKIKRANMKQLGAYYKLTGYVKIGWPGIIIIEGSEESCQDFYDDIKVWNWKYLVVRGEQQEKVGKGASLDSLRRFESFLEVSDMSIVATHCRENDLEALFRTIMKVYDNSNEHDGATGITSEKLAASAPYGTLVWVDHMNDGKGYRKWLRKTGADTDIFLMIKQCYPNHDFTKRPTILVAIVGDQENVAGFMKRWRTSRVDVDSRGKPCLERKMTVLHEGTMEQFFDLDAVDWDEANAEANLNVSKEQVLSLIETFDDGQWKKSAASVLSTK